MRIVRRMGSADQESSDDDLYSWFVEAIAEEFGAAQEVEPDIIHVWSFVDGEPDTDSRPMSCASPEPSFVRSPMQRSTSSTTPKGRCRFVRRTPFTPAWMPSRSTPRSRWTVART